MILVTGGTGMVGMHLLLSLAQENEPVRATYRSKNKIDEVSSFFAFAKMAPYFNNIEWIKADITDVPSLEIAFTDIRQVYHCAALISFNPYDYRKLRQANVEGTANIVNMSIKYEVEKLGYLSSIATLAKTPNNPINEDNHWDPNVPNSVYAITKYGAEMEVWRGSQEGLDTFIVNPGIILGEGNYVGGSGAIFKRVAKGFKYYSDGGSGVVDVKSVIHTLRQGMASNIVNERYILIDINWTYKQLLTEVAQAIGAPIPKRRLNTLTLSIARFTDMLIGIFTKKRHLTKVGMASLQETTFFDNAKVIKDLDYKTRNINQSLERIAVHFKAQLDLSR